MGGSLTLKKQHMRRPTSAKEGCFPETRDEACAEPSFPPLGELGIPSSLPLDTHRMQSQLGVPRVTLRPACIGAASRPLTAASDMRVRPPMRSERLVCLKGSIETH